MHNAPAPGDDEPGPWPAGPGERGGVPAETSGEWKGWFGEASGTPGATGETAVLPGVAGGGIGDADGGAREPGEPRSDEPRSDEPRSDERGTPDGTPGVPGAPGDPVQPATPSGTGDPAGGGGGLGGTPSVPAGPVEPRAARGTTIALAVALVLVVVMSGVLGAVAVLMTRNPDAPPLKQTPVRRLLMPVHFAPVTGVGPAPCAGTDAIPDDKGTACYQLDPGVTVTTVQKIEEVPESDGTYSIRLVLSPSSQEQIAALTRETVKQQLAIVVGEKVVAAPRVAQEITQDSLGIAGFDKAQADALLMLLTGSGAPTGQDPSPSPPAVFTGQPGGTQPGGTQPGGTAPDGTQQGGTTGGGAQPDGTTGGGTTQQGGGTQQAGTQPGTEGFQ